MSYTRGTEEFYSLVQINSKENQTTKLSCDVAPSNISMLEIKSFGAVNKRALTNESTLIKKVNICKGSPFVC